MYERLVPLPELTVDDKLRFLKKVVRVGDCWIWQASRYDDRYGRFSVKTKTYCAHRISFKLFYYDPKDLLVLHLCNTSLCVNPKHLYAGTSEDNAEDRRLSDHGPKGILNPGAKLTENSVRTIRKLLETKGYISIGKMFGVCSGTIREIAKCRTWTHLK